MKKTNTEKWVVFYYGEKELCAYTVRGVDVSLYDIDCCIDVYNSITRKENPEFINGKVKEILDKCKIKTVEHGIGWKIA